MLEDCGATLCLEVRGACCNGFTGGCTETIQDDCEGQNLAWSQETDCHETTCDPTPGACCDLGDVDALTGIGVCTDGVIQADCQGENNEWTKGTTCTRVVCRVDVVIPTVSEWGLVVLTLLLLLGGKLAFRTRYATPPLW